MFLVAQTQISIIVKPKNYMGSWVEGVHTEVPTGKFLASVLQQRGTQIDQSLLESVSDKARWGALRNQASIRI